jgi:hypothetical protein
LVTTERERERIDRQAEMLARIASERLPDQWLQTKAQEIAPRYLHPEHQGQSEIVLNPDGGVRTPAFPALIECVTMHDGTFPLPFRACNAVGLLNTGDRVQADGGSRTLGSSRGPVLPIGFEGDVTTLKARLLGQGADKLAVKLCDQVFKDGVTIEALEKRMTGEECGSLGVPDGKRFRRFLEVRWRANGQMESHRCRLCFPSKIYKNHRDALRHLLKGHFGLSFECERW